MEADSGSALVAHVIIAGGLSNDAEPGPAPKAGLGLFGFLDGPRCLEKESGGPRQAAESLVLSHNHPVTPGNADRTIRHEAGLSGRSNAGLDRERSTSMNSPASLAATVHLGTFGNP